MGASLAISVDRHPRNISVNYFEIEQLADEETSFQDLALVAILFNRAEPF